MLAHSLIFFPIACRGYRVNYRASLTLTLHGLLTQHVYIRCTQVRSLLCYIISSPFSYRQRNSLMISKLAHFSNLFCFSRAQSIMEESLLFRIQPAYSFLILMKSNNFETSLVFFFLFGKQERIFFNFHLKWNFVSLFC